jgi:hypothetical protein
MRTRELHGPGYYHIGSPADQGYAEHMHAMFDREDMDSLRLEPSRQEQQSMGSSSRGSSSQYTNPNLGWQNRPGQSVTAFPGSRIVPTRRVDPRDTSMQRMLKFGSAKVPKLSKANLVNTDVHLLIQHIHRLLSQEAFDDSVMGNLIDNETITLLGYANPITTHWTIDWDAATIIEALEELYPLQAEHKLLD